MLVPMMGFDVIQETTTCQTLLLYFTVHFLVLINLFLLFADLLPGF